MWVPCCIMQQGTTILGSNNSSNRLGCAAAAALEATSSRRGCQRSAGAYAAVHTLDGKCANSPKVNTNSYSQTIAVPCGGSPSCLKIQHQKLHNSLLTEVENSRIPTQSLFCMDEALRCQIPNLRLFVALLGFGNLRRKWQQQLMTLHPLRTRGRPPADPILPGEALCAGPPATSWGGRTGAPCTALGGATPPDEKGPAPSSPAALGISTCHARWAGP